MYIQETTADERLIVDRAVGSIFAVIERANNTLFAIYERFFCEFKQKEIDEVSAGEISDILFLATDAIHDALLEYSLVVGHDDFPGFSSHLKGAETAQQVVQVEKLLNKIYNVETRKQIMSKSDREALTALQELTKRESVGH